MRPLNIYLVTGSKAARVAGSTIYEDNILKTLQAAGHRVTVYNFEKESAAAGGRDAAKMKALLSEGIARVFAENHQKRAFDLAFCLLNNTVVDPPVLRQLSDKVTTVNYTTNYHQFDLVADIAKYVTLSTYISLPARAAFDQLGVRSFWMPMAANPELYRPSAQKERYASFIGTAYGERPYYMWRLLQRGVDIHVRGPGWTPRPRVERMARNYGEPLLYVLGGTESRLRFVSRNERRLIIERISEAYPDHVGGPLSDAEMTRSLATSEAVVNIAESRFDHDYLNPNVLRGCNLRDFEAPMAGTCLVTQHTRELEHFFDPGKEVLVFHDDVDLADQLLFYMANRSALRPIAEAGHRRAISEHTWMKRFEALFAHLGLA